MARTETRAKDRRVQKTQKLLREALASLVREKDYDSIAVKEILDRANVGRSTFYLHFRDKDELLVSRIHEMLGAVPASLTVSAARPHERLISFSLPFFEFQTIIGTLARAGWAPRAAPSSTNISKESSHN